MGKVRLVLIKVMMIFWLEFIVVIVFICFGEVLKKELDDLFDVVKYYIDFIIVLCYIMND